MSEPSPKAGAVGATEQAAEEGTPMSWVTLLSDEVGGRRPASGAERMAALLVAERLTKAGLSVEQRRFPAYSTFALPYGIALALPLIGALGKRPLQAWLAALTGATLNAIEDGRRHRPLSRFLARGESQNLLATVEPLEQAQYTVCLVCHLDTSRSGLIFGRRFLRILHPAFSALGAAVAATVAAPILRRIPGGRRVLGLAYAVLAAGLALLLERELGGVDVPGANDNASGVAAVATLATELQSSPLQRTRVVCLFTGCEEAGALGADAFAGELDDEQLRSWLFINFDGVGAPATLRFLEREGLARKFSADPALIRLAGEISARRPELGLVGARRDAGLGYDTGPILARGGRGITLSAQDETIPNYHSPSDTAENLDPDVLDHAIEVGREMLAAIDNGAADSP
ncbi:MAG: M28 family metallopeptidase [Solirubrobacterales bacterium]